MTDRQSYTIEEIQHMLCDRVNDVAYHYAPASQASYEDKGIYFTLNPGRVDRSVGSFYIHLSGPKLGRWTDHATGAYGDLLDLIALNLNCSLSDALREARSFLGLMQDSPADIRRRNEAIAASKERQKEASRQAKIKKEKRAKMGHAVWLSGQEKIAGTPVEYYLRDCRQIDLAQLGRQPRVLRYVPECFYKHTNKETGEVVEGKWPAMVALITDGAGKPIACHRTYLELGSDGRWGKASVPEAKKVLGDYAGGSINLWSGSGPRGGKGSSLSKCPPDTHVYISEGIEDALSCVMLLPEVRVLAAISLSNFGAVQLPENVTKVTLIADRDEHAASKLALQRAGQMHRAAGRQVYLYQNQSGGKDLNDDLRRLKQESANG